jgi:hypothetical protein
MTAASATARLGRANESRQQGQAGHAAKGLCQETTPSDQSHHQPDPPFFSKMQTREVDDP